MSYKPLILVILITACGQDLKSHSYNKVEIDEALAQMSEEFLQDGLRVGANMARYYAGAYIAVDPIPERENVLGMCTRWEDGDWNIRIDPATFEFPEIIVKAVVYHELFHCVGNLDHDNTPDPRKIMNESVWVNSPEYYSDNWDALISYEFNRMGRATFTAKVSHENAEE